ncbi:MAG TPA: LptA/OstA family protein, partial [Candidatus Obscuribacterales bacterium]
MINGANRSNIQALRATDGAGGARSHLVPFFGGAVGLLLALIAPGTWLVAQAQTGEQGTITLRADVQEANAITGVITARGNVQIEYPVRDIYATSAQAQYFSEENRMILSGNVVVLQEGNRLEAETVTYLVDEGRFIALPQPNDQVETTYILRSTEESGTAAGGAATDPAAPANNGAIAP